ncbi:MAG: type II secretion system F family protein [Candidatus Wallbacteria bacterium]|nr:type II secretion system F family protein [Candidatus Wallbacteria bacterium]
MGFVAIICLILFVAFLLIYQMMRQPRDQTMRTLGVEGRFFLALSRPLIDLAIRMNRQLGIDQNSQTVKANKQHLDAAGILEMDGEELLAAREVTACVMAFFTLLMLAVIAGTFARPHPWMGALIMFCFGLNYPILKVQQRARARKEKIFQELPYVIDLISLAIEAGLDFKMAVERLIAFSEPSPLIEELKVFHQDLDLGATMEDALKHMGERIDILAFFSFVESIVQATTLGIDVSSTLRAQAEQMRIAIYQDLEKGANAAPVLILFPTVFCIFPPLLIILMAPLIIKFQQFHAFFAKKSPTSF